MRSIAGNAVSAKTTTHNLQRRYGAFCFGYVPARWSLIECRHAVNPSMGLDGGIPAANGLLFVQTPSLLIHNR